MTLELLHRLSAQTPPIAITCADEVDAVHVLMLAGHLKATLALPVCRSDGVRSRSATVHGVTRLGWWMLQQFPPTARSSSLDPVQ
jgi:hypothetical protein